MAVLPIHRSARDGDLQKVKLLIEQGVSVDRRDGGGCTPLHWAAEYGRREVAELLISSQCDLELRDHRRGGLTPLMCAAYFNRKDVVDLLLQRGAQVNCADDYKWTLLHVASRWGWLDVMQRIVESGGTDVDAENIDIKTPLIYAAIQGREDVAALLIRAGADVNRSNQWKQTALHLASRLGNTNVVRVLLEEEGLDLNPRDEDSQTPLYEACREGHLEIVRHLLMAKADTNLKNNNNETALSVGIERERLNLETIRLLVQYGAFFEDSAQISKNPLLKEHVLKDVDLCTRSIVNKFHCQSLPALYSNPLFARSLPPIENWKLSAQQTREIANFVESEIEARTFCNVVDPRPTLLSLMCVQTLLSQDPTRNKRSASQAFSSGNSPLKKPCLR